MIIAEFDVGLFNRAVSLGAGNTGRCNNWIWPRIREKKSWKTTSSDTQTLIGPTIVQIESLKALAKDKHAKFTKAMGLW
jgi:hypothetical protein